MAVCPAGEEVIAPFQNDPAGYLSETVKPLQDKRETIYVVKGSDAEAHVAKRFPHKTVRQVGNSLRPQTIRGFLSGLSFVFQPKRAKGLDATYHFTFDGEERVDATVGIRDGRVTMVEGHQGEPRLRIGADSRTWLGFVRKERSLVWALLRRKIRVRGNPKHLVAFGRCFLG
jgi:hypothetical protein